jgi:hypothetical protein
MGSASFLDQQRARTVAHTRQRASERRLGDLVAELRACSMPLENLVRLVNGRDLVFDAARTG